jgi:hypothetical protein
MTTVRSLDKAEANCLPVVLTETNGIQPPLERGIIKKFFLISSWVLLRRSQSKIVRLNFDRLSYRADSELVELHAEVQNPKSKIEMTLPSLLYAGFPR